uniref:Tail tube B n=1 Tax=uncultured marine virus TaxID=186617 RepID=A0A0F7LAI2_9VIRU|nr:tail tube B [uncultured marine virus]
MVGVVLVVNFGEDVADVASDVLTTHDPANLNTILMDDQGRVEVNIEGSDQGWMIFLPKYCEPRQHGPVQNIFIEVQDVLLSQSAGLAILFGEQ